MTPIALTEAQVVIFTVPTTCSRPSIEMVGFIYVCIYLIITVPTTCSRPSIEMVGFIINIIIIIFTVPTACSRPSIEMVGFIYLCIYFSVFTPLTRRYLIKRSNMAQKCQNRL